MKKVSQGDSIPRVLRQPNNGIKGYESKSGEEQMELFAELVENRGGDAVKKLWPKLDLLARSFVMEQLGCFAGPDCPQEFFRPRFEEGRALIKVTARQIKRLKKFIAVLEKSVCESEELNYHFSDFGRLIHEVGLTVEKLERVKAVSSKYFGGPYDREIRSIVEAQEFVKRRTTYKGRKVALSLATVAEVFELNERELKRPSSRDMAGRLHKALLRFRGDSDHGRYMNEIGDFIRDWKLPDPPVKSGHSEP